MLMPPSTAFRTQRLTSNTFLVSEHSDVYQEHPQIFVKRVPSAQTIVVIDTGCGGASEISDVEITSLRTYLEEIPLECNDNQPLNTGGSLQYVVVLTHCHYDHILAIEQFCDSRILVSAHSPSFISASNLPKHSLCESLGIRTPHYLPQLVPHHHEVHSMSNVPLGILILHTPGHVPDELAIYDKEEKMLYVGDTLYEDEMIIFPNEGSIVEWFASTASLITLVKTEGPDVRINSGHKTSCRPAYEVLHSTRNFIKDVVMGKEPVQRREWRRGEENVVYLQEGGRFSLRCPERLVLEAREHKGV
ncbi:Lactamase-B domain-containing protein [Mycena indigotica]|uniref:Lactamase-B domain-containing protein n=1 Tax=Mycena indigotica TaxID=2126181 RepID=A0A8H6WB67_9AGAR|nr:Lactamase-B domain-containing protein [Mycena indigotica]KAF7312314.1 Lactamase-B domain-containing protein [Mycena indigotica]